MLRKLRRRVLIEEDLAKSSKMQHLENKDKWHFCKAGSFSNGESPRTLPLKELHSTGETIVWRDPGGSWACLPPVYHLFMIVCEITLPQAVTCTTPKKHTMSRRRETQEMLTRTKPQEELGTKRCIPPLPPTPQHSELKEPHEMLNKAKTLTIAR